MDFIATKRLTINQIIYRKHRKRFNSISTRKKPNQRQRQSNGFRNIMR